MLRPLLAMVWFVLWVGVAQAQAPSPPTVITGRATDLLGKPIRDARVFVLPRDGERIATRTDEHGRYRVEVQGAGTYGIVLEIDKAHTFRTVLAQEGVANTADLDVELDISGGEVIQIVDRKRPVPTTEPKPVTRRTVLPPYSEEAMERDAWARAWLLLDVDERGAVTRVKLLKAPGFDLDRICIEEALALAFEPARDAAGRPMKTYMLWVIEWPAWSWLLERRGLTDRAPSIAQVPCAGTGPLHLDLRAPVYRDCSKPDLAKAESLPWITRATIATAVRELKQQHLRLVLEEKYEPGTPWPGYIGAGASVVLWAATAYSFYEYSRWQDKAARLNWEAGHDAAEHEKVRGTRDRWGKRALGTTAAAVLSSGATLLLWHRHQRRSSFSVQPTESKGRALFGATATYQLAF